MNQEIKKYNRNMERSFYHIRIQNKHYRND